MNIVIAGYGEIGQAIHSLYESDMFNIAPVEIDGLCQIRKADVLNICFPYSDTFVRDVTDYIARFNPRLTIIHSTVLPGTTDSIDADNIVYSPVIGVHPQLDMCLKTFKKFIGGKTSEAIVLTQQHFALLGLESMVFASPKAVETAKTLCTLYYGMCISFHDEANDLCQREGLQYDEVMTAWNSEYNRGYTALGKSNVCRPVLFSPDGKIGGHCVVPNAKMIASYFKSVIIKYVLRLA
jgi:UDP-N-acetyl-D-mannosaminuronate dehydrogenase